MQIASSDTLKAATIHLAKHDPILARLIKSHKKCDISPHTNYYQELVDSIIGQQLSVKAARSILNRFIDLFGGTFPKPDQILAKSPEELRAVGLSNAKAAYVQDLAHHVMDGRLVLDKLNLLSNEEIIQELTAVKGIGEWTAHMFLLFAMGRLDVLAHGDLGIKNGIRAVYNFDHLPTAKDIQDLSKKNNWHPYESVACWYIWQSLDNA